MNLKEIIGIINGTLLYDSEEISGREYSYAIASDLMSNVMLETVDDSILITSLVNTQVIRASEMMNITCIIITCGKTVTDVMVELAMNRNIALVETDYTTFTVCGKLHSLGLTEGPVTFEEKNITSIKLDTDRCIGCIHCVRNCPAEAIRIRSWKAVIMPERCIDCGICVKVCPRHAVKPIVDSIDRLQAYDHRIAIPSSAFLSQFRNVRSRNHLLTALRQVGFDDIYEEAIGAEMISAATKKLMTEGKGQKPLISSGCPAVLKLIQIKFPNLLDNVLEYRPPVEIVAAIAREEAERKYPGRSIGIFFIAPCTSKISFIRESDEIKETDIDEMVAISEIYRAVRRNLKNLEYSDVEDLEKTGAMGLRWATPGGESLALGTDRFIAVDGIDEVMDIFEKAEDGRLEGVEFIEAEACVGGCCGGSLTVENCYSAKANLKVILDEAKAKYGDRIINCSDDPKKLLRNRPLNHRPVLQLDEDLNVAIKKMEELGRIVKTLPGVDCGVCGAPTCRAFAEDIVRGHITERACIILNRTRGR